MYHEPCPNCGREFETQSEWRSHTGGQCDQPMTPLVRPRALTLIQPWATLIAKGLKTYETRSWAPAYRGPLLIHAGAKVDREFTTELIADGVLAEDEKLPSMAILCVVDLWECHKTPGRFPEAEYTYGDLSPGRWAWELRNLRVLRVPVGIKGQLGSMVAGSGDGNHGEYATGNAGGGAMTTWHGQRPDQGRVENWWRLPGRRLRRPPVWQH